MQTRDQFRGECVNVGFWERWGSAAAGSGLIVLGLWRRSWPGLAVALGGAALVRRGVTGHCAAYQVAGVKSRNDRTIEVQQSLTVRCTPDEAYRFANRVDTYARVMKNLEQIDELEPGLVSGIVKTPDGQRTVWKVRIVDDRPNQRIAWESTDAGNPFAGELRFSPVESGHTEVGCRFGYPAQRGLLAQTAARIASRGLARQIKENLHRLKLLIESGAVPSVAGRPANGRQHAAGAPGRPRPDRVGEASEGSFPASDAPPWTAPLLGRLPE